MDHIPTWRRFLRARRLIVCAASALALWPALPVHAQEDPPGRVGRVAEVQGGVSWYDHEQGNWATAERNRPLTSGDRLSTAAGARVEMRVGSSVLRLGPGSEMEVLRLDDERVVLQLHAGALAVRLRSREAAEETEVLTAEARLLPQRAGHYRFDRIDDTTQAGAWRGELRVDAPNGLQVNDGQRVALTREGRGELHARWNTLPDDAFGAWVARDDQRDERSASARFVSPEMTGAEDLDRYGRWDQHPEFGAIWYPQDVRAEWEPYRYGHWAWVRPWGWTWIDEAPWGFAPFHYGRWVSWQGRWGWVPGAYVARPVYAPALVAWGGSGGVGVTVRIGSPPVAWAPLAPRDAYRPYYRTSPVYVERINPAPPYRWHNPPSPQPGWPATGGQPGRDWQGGERRNERDGAGWLNRIERTTQQAQPSPQAQPQPQPQPRVDRPAVVPEQSAPRHGPAWRPAPATPTPPQAAPVQTVPAAAVPVPLPPRRGEREPPRAPEKVPEKSPEKAPEKAPDRTNERPADKPAAGARERQTERPRDAEEQRQRRPEAHGSNPRERDDKQR